MSEPTTADVLNRAADYIEEHGWTRGAFSRDGRVCAAGAIHAVIHGDPNRCCCGTEDAPMEPLARIIGISADELAPWNDGQKSRGPVVEALRCAAAEAAR